MASRTFTAESIQAAISMVKESIGPDAVILNTRRLPKKTRDPYGKDMFEVVATQPSPPAVQSGKAGASLLKRSERPQSQPALNAHNSMNSNESAEKSASALETIQAELDSLKDMIKMLSFSDGIPDSVRSLPECMNLFNRLAGTGLTERRARRFMSIAFEAMEGKDFSASDLNRKVIDVLLGTLEVIDPFTEINNGNKNKAFALIGPTGSGKTTTIAKLAAELSIVRKLKVGVISVDGYRIGALEQIKTYTSIMGIQCMAAFSKEELALAMSKMEGKDVILIDTAGYSHFDTQKMNEISALIHKDEDISSLLVLSATTSKEDMLEASKRYAALNPCAYIFTKLDETCRPGVILDQILDMRMPVAFMTNGQKVPDDLVAATRKKIMGFVFEGRKV